MPPEGAGAPWRAGTPDGVVDGQRVFLGSALGSDFYPASGWFSGWPRESPATFLGGVVSCFLCPGKWDESVRENMDKEPWAQSLAQGRAW